MSRLQGNRKMLLTVIAGVLATVVVIGAGTYAWFTGRDTVEAEGEVYTAKVGVNADDLVVDALDFYDGAGKNISLQIPLEAFAGQMGTPMFATAAGNLIKASIPDMVFFEKEQLPLTPAQVTANANKFVLIKNAFGKTSSGVIYNVTPGSFLQAKYNFSVDGSSGGDHSYIPVYFRVQAAKLYAQGSPAQVDYAQTMTAVIKGKPVSPAGVNDGNLVVGTVELKLVNGWYYCAIPLSPEYGWNVDVALTTYLFGKTNGNDLQITALIYGNEVNGQDVAVEVIQATNNAVLLADEWKEVENRDSNGTPLNGEFFKPYFNNPELYAEYLAQWLADGI